ncbi:unnamed protein product [Sphacelaria rigidula]
MVKRRNISPQTEQKTPEKSLLLRSPSPPSSKNRPLPLNSSLLVPEHWNQPVKKRAGRVEPARSAAAATAAPRISLTTHTIHLGDVAGWQSTGSATHQRSGKDGGGDDAPSSKLGVKITTLNETKSRGTAKTESKSAAKPDPSTAAAAAARSLDKATPTGATGRTRATDRKLGSKVHGETCGLQESGSGAATTSATSSSSRSHTGATAATPSPQVVATEPSRPTIFTTTIMMRSDNLEEGGSIASSPPSVSTDQFNIQSRLAATSVAAAQKQTTTTATATATDPVHRISYESGGFETSWLQNPSLAIVGREENTDSWRVRSSSAAVAPNLSKSACNVVSGGDLSPWRDGDVGGCSVDAGSMCDDLGEILEYAVWASGDEFLEDGNGGDGDAVAEGAVATKFGVDVPSSSPSVVARPRPEVDHSIDLHDCNGMITEEHDTNSSRDLRISESLLGVCPAGSSHGDHFGGGKVGGQVQIVTDTNTADGGRDSVPSRLFQHRSGHRQHRQQQQHPALLGKYTRSTSPNMVSRSDGVAIAGGFQQQHREGPRASDTKHAGHGGEWKGLASAGPRPGGGSKISRVSINWGDLVNSGDGSSKSSSSSNHQARLSVDSNAGRGGPVETRDLSSGWTDADLSRAVGTIVDVMDQRTDFGESKQFDVATSGGGAWGSSGSGDKGRGTSGRPMYLDSSRLFSFPQHLLGTRQQQRRQQQQPPPDFPPLDKFVSSSSPSVVTVPNNTSVGGIGVLICGDSVCNSHAEAHEQVEAARPTPGTGGGGRGGDDGCSFYRRSGATTLAQ